MKLLSLIQLAVMALTMMASSAAAASISTKTSDGKTNTRSLTKQPHNQKLRGMDRTAVQRRRGLDGHGMSMSMDYSSHSSSSKKSSSKKYGGSADKGASSSSSTSKSSKKSKKESSHSYKDKSSKLSASEDHGMESNDSTRNTRPPIVIPTESPVAAPTEAPAAAPFEPLDAPTQATVILVPTEPPVVSPVSSPVASPTGNVTEAEIDDDDEFVLNLNITDDDDFFFNMTDDDNATIAEDDGDDPLLVTRSAPDAPPVDSGSTLLSDLPSDFPSMVPSSHPTVAPEEEDGVNLPPPPPPETMDSPDNVPDDPSLAIPDVTKSIYVEPIQLKAHSEVDLVPREQDMFDILSTLFATYLQKHIGGGLEAFTVHLDLGESHIEQTTTGDVMITHFDVGCTLEYHAATLDEYDSSPTYEEAATVVRAFFNGSDLFELLGRLRAEGIFINEIVHEDDEFRSNIFNAIVHDNGNKPVKVAAGDSGNGGGSGGSSAGMIAGIMGAMMVFVAVGYGIITLNNRKRSRAELEPLSLDSHTGSSGSRATSVDWTERLPKRVLSPKLILRHKKNKKQSTNTKQTNLSAQATSRNAASFRKNAISGTPPPVESSIKPAKIQRKPAFSKDYIPIHDSSSVGGSSAQSPIVVGERVPLSPSAQLSPSSTPSFSEHQSVASNYNVPSDYSYGLRTSPLIDGYSRAASSKSSSPKSAHSSQQDEFSMPSKNLLHSPTMLEESIRSKPSRKRVRKPRQRRPKPSTALSPNPSNPFEDSSRGSRLTQSSPTSSDRSPTISHDAPMTPAVHSSSTNRFDEDEKETSPMLPNSPGVLDRGSPQSMAGWSIASYQTRKTVAAKNDLELPHLTSP